MLSLWKNLRDRLDQIGSDPDPIYISPVPTWEPRPNEQHYARLAQSPINDANCYGQKIDLIDLTEGKIPANESLFINANPAIGENPNRYKQHGFYFNADNCIGCHACEAACSEKNGNPAHISFRSVGYVEGGTYPDFKRMNISMACNHCDDPVCLKGCPTRAYTKHLEYGAVLQDPDTCFGCGYCTWVCPYNAPQLDPVKGQVSKCNMCVDRLEEGLKPACASACLGNALDFGVVEQLPANREQNLTQIPGFPDPEITHPNIRFQQTRSMPNEVSRTDSMPIKYAKDEKGKFRSVVDEKVGKAMHWSINKLSSRENPLVLFTLATQAVIGAFTLSVLGDWLGVSEAQALWQSPVSLLFLGVLIGLQVGGLVLSTIHLGKPLRFYRGFNNLQHSPLSREALGVAAFLAMLVGFTVFKSGQFWLSWNWLGWVANGFAILAIICAVAGLWFMHKIYRIKARPFWNHWQVITTFFGSALSLGGIFVGIFAIPLLLNQQASFFGALKLNESASVLLATISVGLFIELLGLYFHNRYLHKENGEGAASHYVQLTTFGKSYWLRNGLMALAAAMFLVVAIVGLQGVGVWLALLSGVAAIISALIGRALFYVLVIPTTMPGAFFWKNKGFEQHARDIGLANMPQVGVVPLSH